MSAVRTAVRCALGACAAARPFRFPAWVFAAWRAARRIDLAAPVLRLRSAADEIELRRRARLQDGLVPAD